MLHGTVRHVKIGAEHHYIELLYNAKLSIVGGIVHKVGTDGRSK